MSAADLLRQGQNFLKREFPALIQIGNQCYAAGTAGINRGFDLGEGMGHPRRRASFWVSAQAFLDAGQPAPRELSKLTWLDAPSAPQGGLVLTIKSVITDPAAVNITLVCEEQPS